MNKPKYYLGHYVEQIINNLHICCFDLSCSWCPDMDTNTTSILSEKLRFICKLTYLIMISRTFGCTYILGDDWLAGQDDDGRPDSEWRRKGIGKETHHRQSSISRSSRFTCHIRRGLCSIQFDPFCAQLEIWMPGHYYIHFKWDMKSISIISTMSDADAIHNRQPPENRLISTRYPSFPLPLGHL